MSAEVVKIKDFKNSQLSRLKEASAEQVMNFIRFTLSRGYSKSTVNDSNRHGRPFHLRFNMSGYDNEETGSCTLYNQMIINKFAYLGIYDNTEYLFLDFYKGCGILYFKPWLEKYNEEINMGGLGTTEIIYQIFQHTIFSDKSTRRRD